MADFEMSTAVTMDHEVEVKHDAYVKDGCQITNVHMSNKFSIHEDVVNREKKILNTGYIRVKEEVDDGDASDFSENCFCNVVVGTDDEAREIETLLSLQTQSLASEPYQCESVGLDDKFMSAEANLTETREEEGDQCKAETCQTEEIQTGELDEGHSETHESMEDESSKSVDIQQTEESEAIDKVTYDYAVQSGEMEEDQSECVAEIIKIEECEVQDVEGHCENVETHETEESEAIDEDTCDHAEESGELEEDQSEYAVAEIIKIEECVDVEGHCENVETHETEESEAIDEDTCDHAEESGELEEDQSEYAVAEIIKIEECEDVEGHCQNAETHETEELEVEGGHSDFAETNQVEDDMNGSDEVKVQSNKDEEVKQTDEVINKDNDKDEQDGEVADKIHDEDEEIKRDDKVKNQNIEKNVNSKKQTLNENDPDLQTHPEASQFAASNKLKRKREKRKMKERDCDEGQGRTSPFGKTSQPVTPNVSIPPANLQHGQPVNLQTGNVFVQTTTAAGQVYYFNVQTRVSTWGRPQNACIISRAAWEIVRSNMAQGFTKTEAERLSTAGVPQAQTNVQQNAAMDSDSSDESEEEVVEEKKKQPEVVEEKKVEPKPGQKPVNKPRPVACTPIPGTVWCVVRTDDGKCFFYEPSKRRSVWKRPEELKNRPDVDKLLSTKPEVKTVPSEKVEVRNVQEEPPSKQIRSEAEVKEVTEESNHEVTQQIVLGAEAAMLPGVESSQHSSVVPLEVSKSLLAEKDDFFQMRNNFMKSLSEIPGINHCSTWNDVKSKVSSDSCYETLFSHSHRVNWFWEYLKILNDVKNDFMKMLRQIPEINHSTIWSDVKSKVTLDPRYETLFSDSHREDWFSEYLKNLNDVKKDFMKMLREIPKINHSTTWSDVKSKVTSDPRYETLFTDSHLEDWFNEYLKNLNDLKNDFMKRLSEITDINDSTTWSGVKSKVSLDPRYKAGVTDSHLKIWFQEYLKDLNDVKSDFIKMLVEIADITKCTTWCDVKSKVSSHSRYKAVVSDSYEEAWFNEYLKIVNYLKTNFMKRLSEIPDINNSTTWSDVKWKVNSDIRYKFYVSNSHQEDWFQEYLKNLYNAKNDFMKRLSGMPGIKNSTPWSDVKKYADSYPGFEAFSNSHLENWFREYLKTLNDVKNDLMKRLSEIPGINDSTTWSEVESKVSPDPCSEDLFSNSHRENWFREYLKTLDDTVRRYIGSQSKPCSTIDRLIDFVSQKANTGSGNMVDRSTPSVSSNGFAK